LRCYLNNAVHQAVGRKQHRRVKASQLSLIETTLLASAGSLF